MHTMHASHKSALQGILLPLQVATACQRQTCCKDTFTPEIKQKSHFWLDRPCWSPLALLCFCLCRPLTKQRCLLISGQPEIQRLRIARGRDDQRVSAARMTTKCVKILRSQFPLLFPLLPLKKAASSRHFRTGQN